MRFFDSHAHISSDALFEMSALLIQEAEKNGVLKIVNIATDKKTLERGLELEKHYPSIVHNTAAITPHDADTLGDDVFDFFKAAALKGSLVAVGETGLDYHYMPASKEKQKEIFIRHLQLALETRLPIIIHCREAFDDLYEILDAEYINQPNSLPGVMHCFTGTPQEAKSALDRGWFISFSGIVTFNKSHILKEVAAMTPLDKMLIETDAPYLAPNPLRGKQNQPSFVTHTAKVLAALKNLPLETLAIATWENGHIAFKIDPHPCGS